MTSAARKKLTAVAAVLVAAGAMAYLAFGNMERNLVYYWTPSDLIKKTDAVRGTTVRLGGMVQKGSLHWDPDAVVLRFRLGENVDAAGPSVDVLSRGAPPQMFREGIGCVVEGKFDGKVFQTDRVLVKHSNEYHPPKPGENPRELYRTLAPQAVPVPEGTALRDGPRPPQDTAR